MSCISVIYQIKFTKNKRVFLRIPTDDNLLRILPLGFIF